jgi:MoaA/NifB/PqqE/SkfB family radical SAM enzyme
MKKINFFNIRFGLACNSSSSHSILFLPFDEIKKTKIKTDEYSDFQWDFFTAANKESKNNYLYALVENAFCQLVPPFDKNVFYQKIFGNFDSINENSSIDHQSVITLPSRIDGTINLEFIEDFQKFLLQDNVIIVGGNDNEDRNHPLKGKEEANLDFLPKEEKSAEWLARKDKKYGFWTLFNRSNGFKIRFSFDELVKTPSKASAPELVDIKFTDFCPFSCDFCYQDSTLQGKHASMENIRYIVQKLKEAEVFEVAGGGGEITLHPNFAEIVKLFKDNGIVFNFTTRNYHFFKNTEAHSILDNCGAIAFSINSVDDLKKVQAACMDVSHPKVNLHAYQSSINLQYVMGTTNLEVLKDILIESANKNLNITLLGYKTVGRGDSFIPENYDGWMDVLREVKKSLLKEGKYLQVSIDTALAAQYKEELEDMGVNLKTFHTTEGNFSLYIDAVNKTMGPSSYSGDYQKTIFDDSWLEKYEIIGIEAPKEKPKKSIKIKN